MATALVSAIDALRDFVHSHKNRQLTREEMRQLEELNACVEHLSAQSRIRPIDPYEPRGIGSYGITNIPAIFYQLEGRCNGPDFVTLVMPRNHLNAWDARIVVFRYSAQHTAEHATDDPEMFVWMTATETARYIGVNERTVRRWIIDGKLPQLDVDGTKYKFFKDVLDTYKAARKNRRTE